MVSSGSQPYQRPLPGRPPCPSPDPLCWNSRRYLQVFPGGKHLDPYRADGYENLCTGDRSQKSPDPLCWSSWRGAIQNNRRGKNLGVRRHRANSEMDLCPGNRSRNPSTVYAGTGGGIFKTTNGGATWKRTIVGLTHLITLSLTVDPQNARTVYAGTLGGVFKTGTEETAWRKRGLPGARVLCLVPDLENPQILYAGTLGGVFKTTDGGAFWGEADEGLANTKVLSLTVHPANSHTLYAGTLDGIFKTTDAGASWTSTSTGMTNTKIQALATHPSHPHTLYAGTAAGIFKTTDAGASWTSTSAGMTNTNILSLIIHPSHPHTLYAGTLNSVFKSTDAGASWTPSSTGLTNTEVRTLAIHPSHLHTLYAGTYDGVFKSVDGGMFWTPVNTGLINKRILFLIIHPATPGQFTPRPRWWYLQNDEWGSKLDSRRAGRHLCLHPDHSPFASRNGICRNIRTGRIPNPIKTQKKAGPDRNAIHSPLPQHKFPCEFYSLISNFASLEAVSSELRSFTETVSTTCPGTTSFKSSSI